jgi:hypothetical protein
MHVPITAQKSPLTHFPPPSCVDEGDTENHPRPESLNIRMFAILAVLRGRSMHVSTTLCQSTPQKSAPSSTTAASVRSSAMTQSSRTKTQGRSHCKTLTSTTATRTHTCCTRTRTTFRRGSLSFGRPSTHAA